MLQREALNRFAQFCGAQVVRWRVDEIPRLRERFARQPDVFEIGTRGRHQRRNLGRRFSIARESIRAVFPSQRELRGTDDAERARKAVTPGRQPIGQPGRGPQSGFRQVGRRTEAKCSPGDGIAGSRGNQQQLLLFRRKTLGPGPGAHRGRLHLEPVGQALLADQPDGSRTGRFGFVEKVGAHAKSLSDQRGYALMHKAFPAAPFH